MNAQGHARDVSDAHGGGEGGGQGLEVVDVPRVLGVVILSPDDVHRMHEVPDIDPAHAEGDENPRAEQEDAQPGQGFRGLPDPLVARFDDFAHEVRN